MYIQSFVVNPKNDDEPEDDEPEEDELGVPQG
jgi:hypothetical protein